MRYNQLYNVIYWMFDLIILEYIYSMSCLFLEILKNTSDKS